MYLGKNEQELNSGFDFSDEPELDESAATKGDAAAQRQPRLSRAAECTLIVRVQSGEPGAVDLLLERYEGFLVDHIGKKYSTWPLSFGDKLNCARLGLITAAQKFDLASSSRLTTYAAWWIRAKFSEVVERDGLIGGKIVKRSREVRRKETETERANLLNGGVWINSGDVSLDAPISDDGESSDGHDTHSDNGAWAEWIDRGLDAKARVAALNRAQRILTWRDRYVFRARFGLNQRTHREIGEELGLSAERVRQIEAKALEKIAVAVKDRHRRHESNFFSFAARPVQIDVPRYWEYVRRLHNRWPTWPTRVWRPGEFTGTRPGPCYSTPRLAWFQRSSAWPRSEQVAA